MPGGAIDGRDPGGAGGRTVGGAGGRVLDAPGFVALGTGFAAADFATGAAGLATMPLELAVAGLATMPLSLTDAGFVAAGGADEGRRSIPNGSTRGSAGLGGIAGIAGRDVLGGAIDGGADEKRAVGSRDLIVLGGITLARATVRDAGIGARSPSTSRTTVRSSQRTGGAWGPVLGRSTTNGMVESFARREVIASAFFKKSASRIPRRSRRTRGTRSAPRALRRFVDNRLQRARRSARWAPAHARVRPRRPAVWSR
ncbi:hypothetical protein DB32_008546 [Sandaracinus amylolyticus]|uniref:Uncharacterized protein n=1 Tax=Sandaracinus amylolyticus TaxID=927083 RepID=A0A0F6YMT5_9BACT|nr:hypothetical protein DB32_008546 [Sandaracinus amylolyticus]